MARFGREFVRAATQPQFAQGLFTAAQQIGSAPARRRQMGMLRDMTPVEQADYFASIATTPDQMLQAQQLKTSAVKQARDAEELAARTTFNSLEAARQAETDPEKKKKIEARMIELAPKAGIDPITISGRTQREEDQELQREFLRNRAEDERRTKQETAIAEAYYAVPEESREQFESNVRNSGFGSVIDAIREDRKRGELVDLQLNNARTQAAENVAMRKAPLPTDSTRTRLEEADINPEIKDYLLSRLNDITQPNFEAEETWNPGERNQALTALTSINSGIRQAIITEGTRKESIRREIRELEELLTRAPTDEQIKAQIPKAQEELATVRNIPGTDIKISLLGYESVREETDKDVIRQKAIELARLERDARIRSVINRRRVEIGLEPILTEEEEMEQKIAEIVALSADGEKPDTDTNENEELYSEADRIVTGG
jgi:hypothetical protein